MEAVIIHLESIKNKILLLIVITNETLMIGKGGHQKNTIAKRVDWSKTIKQILWKNEDLIESSK